MDRMVEPGSVAADPSRHTFLHTSAKAVSLLRFALKLSLSVHSFLCHHLQSVTLPRRVSQGQMGHKEIVGLQEKE